MFQGNQALDYVLGKCGIDICLLSPAGRAGDYKTHSVRVFVCY